MNGSGGGLEHLKSLLDAGSYEEARAALLAFDSRGLADSEAHLALAGIAERTGELERAVLEYNLCLKANPSNEGAIRRLARLRQDRGEYDRAMRAYRRLLELAPGDEEASGELGSILEELGRPGDAIAVLEEAVSKRASPKLALELERLQRPGRKSPSAVEGEAEQGPVTEIAPGDADCVHFATLFAGREGVYARQWTSPTGKHGYTPVEEPFTPVVARQHLLGAFTAGVYPLRMDNTVSFLAFDLDIARFALSRESRDARGVERVLKQAQVGACQIVDAAASLDLECLIEDSGWKGRHVWLFFETPVPAAAARRLAEMLLEAAGALPAEVSVEVFPKQSRVAEGGLGNLIKVPLGIHRVTSRRSLFVNAAGRPVPDQLGCLREAPRIPRGRVRSLVERSSMARVAVSPLEGDEEEQAGALGPVPPEFESREARRPSMPVEAPSYQPEQDLEFQWILDRCGVLGEIERRARSGGILGNDERMVLTYTAGHLTKGPDAVNSVLSTLLNVEQTALLKSRLKGNPMSCPKIRSRVPEVAASVGCNCKFEASAGLYPNPLLHLNTLRSRGIGGGTMSLTRLQVERIVSDLIRIRSEMERLGRLARELEQKLADFMEETGTAELSTAAGQLSRDPHSGRLSLGFTQVSLLQPAAEAGNDRALRDGAGGGGRGEAGQAGGAKGSEDA